MRFDILERILISLQPKIKYFLRPAAIITPLLSTLVFASLALSEGSDEGIRVKINTRERIDATTTPLGNVTVKIGPSTVTTNGAGEASTVVPPGSYIVKAYLQGFIVTDMSVYPDALGGTHGGGPAKSDEGDLDLPFLYRSSYEDAKDDSTLTVYMKPGDRQEKERRSRVSAISEEDCKDFDWDSLFAVFSRNQSDTRFQLDETGEDRLLEPGTYEVSIGHYVGQGPIQAELSKVVVSQEFKSSWREVEYPANDAGKAQVNLEKGMWEGEAAPEIKLYVIGLCDEVGQIDLIKGEAWVDMPNSTSRKAKYHDRVYVGERIRTLTGGSIELKTNNGYLIQIGEKTELKVGLVATATGRRYLERLISLDMGKIQIIRLVDNATPKSNPASRPKTTGISVKTPTATATPDGTNFTISYDEKTNTTTVSVDEGKVKVAPANASLKPLTLEAHQQVQVAQNNISAVTYFSASNDDNSTARRLLFVGIGFAALVAVSGLLFFIYRQHRRATQPAFHQARTNPGVLTDDARANLTAAGAKRCPNPQCGRIMPAHYKYCSTCRSRLE